jgi:hypothetical protein
VLFATTDVGIAKINQRTKITSLGDRVLHTAASPGWKAGTRSAAPPRLPLAWAEWEQALKGTSPEPILERIAAMLEHVPAEKRPAIEAVVEKAKASADPVSALTTVANKIAVTFNKEAA